MIALNPYSDIFKRLSSLNVIKTSLLDSGFSPFLHSLEHFTVILLLNTNKETFFYMKPPSPNFIEIIVNYDIHQLLMVLKITRERATLLLHKGVNLRNTSIYISMSKNKAF